MATITKIPRREFIKLTAASSAFLALGCVPSAGQENKIVKIETDAVPGTGLNAYVFINDKGEIIIFNHRPEMGQGTYQSIPMIIAEELEVDLSKVTITQSPANRSKYGDQMVVGSRSIQNNYELMRNVGASAKEMLIKAAANRWKVPVRECYAEDATVIHKASDKRLGYHELVADASKLEVPSQPTLKSPKEFKIIGKPTPRRDIPLKVNGSAQFGIDCVVPGMLYASIERSPVFLGKILSYNDARAKKFPGVKFIFKTSRNVYGYDREGLAVLADSYYAAQEARKLLEVVWDMGDRDQWDSQKLLEDYKKAAQQDGENLGGNGNFTSTYTGAKKKIEASYVTPYQSHSCMEPMNALVHVQKGKCEFWGSTQNPNGVKSHLARQCKISEDKVIINYTFMGGGFGRRSMTDVVEEAADLSMKSGAPVKVIWSREDDMTQGPFRAASLNVCKGAFDDGGSVVAMEHKVICQDIRNQGPNDTKASRGIAGGVNTDYEIPNFSVRGVLRKSHIPISYWRSVYHSTNCFAHESFMDELAHEAKQDPLGFRLSMLTNHRRFTNVLKEVAAMSKWYSPREKDTGKGVAIVERSGAFIAMVVEVNRVNGKLNVKRVYTAVDCGTTVNPDTVVAQTEGSIVMALTATYKSGHTVKNGAIVEKNFNTYRMLQLSECPEMVVTVMPSTDPPEGAGESGLPTLAPALTNAIFEMTGKRIRTLPFELDSV